MFLFTGTLPASLPAAFRDFDNSWPSIQVLYLSHNSIQGPLPAAWGDEFHGWGPTLSRLYLDNNQLTGILPQLWSDSNSLNLGRVDLFNNQLTGRVTWDQKDLPYLRNLVLLPGELLHLLAFCLIAMQKLCNTRMTIVMVVGICVNLLACKHG